MMFYLIIKWHIPNVMYILLKIIEFSLAYLDNLLSLKLVLRFISVVDRPKLYRHNNNKKKKAESSFTCTVVI